jgi:predicted ATPase
MGKVDRASALAVMSDLAGGLVLHASGDQEPAHATFESAIARYDRSHHAMHLALYQLDPGVISLAQSSRTLWLLGFADRALERAREAVAVGRELGHPGSIAFAMVFMAIVRQFRQEPADALTSAEETIAFCDAHDIAQERAWVLPVRGWAIARLGRGGDGVAATREAIASYSVTGAQHTLPYYIALLADALLASGSPREAMTACDEGLRASERIGETAYDAELHRLRGECRLRLEGAAGKDAACDFEAALGIARTQQARSFELRAAMRGTHARTCRCRWAVDTGRRSSHLA